MIRYFAGHPTIANLLMLVFLGAGLLVAPTLLRETFPRQPAYQVEVNVPYPGARPEDVESAICERIENALDAVTGIARQSCEAREGSARAVVDMVEGGDFQAFNANIKSEIEAIRDFPDRAETANVSAMGQTDFVASVAISGPHGLIDLKDYAEQIRTRMLRWGGIPIVTIKGFSARELHIGLNPDSLQSFGISVSDVAKAVQASSLDLPAGNIETGAETLLIRVAEERRSITSLGNLVVRSSATGGQVSLRQIAEITEQFSSDDNAIIFNGAPAAVLDITKTPSEDSLNIVDEITAFLEAERAQAPPSVVMEITTDGASVVRDRLSLVVVNGLQGLILVFLVLWVFFGFRFAFWVAMGLPVSFMGGVALMGFVGYSLNLMTTLGLLIVIGLLMDDAIVISENIAARREKGDKPLEAVINGSSQVFLNVLASFATTAMVFGSLGFLGGNLGEVLKVVPVVMLFVLVVSLVEAFLILPHHLVHTLEASVKPGGMRDRVDRMMKFATAHIVGPVVDLAIQFRYFTAGLSVAALLLAVAMLAGGFIKFTAFPELDGDTIVARVLLPQGTPIERTKEVTTRLETGLVVINGQFDQPDGQDLIRNVTVSYGVNRDAFESGANVATVSVDLLPSDIRTLRPDAIMDAWRTAVGPVPDVISLKYAEATIGPAGVAIDLRLHGDDLEVLKSASLELQDWLWQYAGVTSVLDDLRPGKRELQITLTEAAGPMGITAAMIADQLRSAYLGTTVSELLVNGQLLEVSAQLADLGDGSFAQFDSFIITRADGSFVPLALVANVDYGQGYNRINRENGVRTLTVQGTINAGVGNANEIVGDTLANFVPMLEERYPGISIGIEGQRAEATITQQSMIKGFGIGLVGVFLLLSFLFRSYIEPLVVMLIIPFSLIGSIFGHMAMGLNFSMPSMLGFVALAGVVVNNSILLVAFVKDEHGSSKSVAEAAAKAARARFRAIFITSLTTVVGLLPILTETSLQAQILIPLVASIVFGLSASSVITLFVLPAFYSILDDFGLSTLAKARRGDRIEGQA